MQKLIPAQVSGTLGKGQARSLFCNRPGRFYTIVFGPWDLPHRSRTFGANLLDKKGFLLKQHFDWCRAIPQRVTMGTLISTGAIRVCFLRQLADVIGSIGDWCWLHIFGLHTRTRTCRREAKASLLADRCLFARRFGLAIHLCNLLFLLLVRECLGKNINHKCLRKWGRAAGHQNEHSGHERNPIPNGKTYHGETKVRKFLAESLPMEIPRNLVSHTSGFAR